MNSRTLLLFAVLTFWLNFPTQRAVADPNPVAPTDALSPEEEKAKFKLPQGFEAQLVVSEPDIYKPMQLCFDAKGRLWVTNSTEYPFPAIGKPGKDRVTVLEDFGPDGKARKVTQFAEDLNIPIGVLPLPDCKSVLVSTIDPGDGKDVKPSCWIVKLTDTDGDGKADKREKLYGPFGVDDTHGMVNSFTLLPDGWVYACHGFRNDSKVKGKDGHEVHMNSGNTFRFRPDGSRIEHWTHGQVNPFGMAVDPYFNLYTADCHSKPITQLIRGAYYESFGKPHDGLGFAPNMMGHLHNSTGMCGLVYYAADHFPKEYHDCMFLGNVTTNRINLDKIEFTGATPRAVEKPDFLVSDDMWFRPTDIKLGPDGALWVSDFYNKIIGHYEVDLKHPGRDKFRGRVWRIVYRGADGKGEAPVVRKDLTLPTQPELFKQLSTPNLMVRIGITNELIERSKRDGKPLTFDGLGDEPVAIAHALWLNSRFLFNVGPNPPRGKPSEFKGNPSEFVVVHLIRSIAVRPDGPHEFRQFLNNLTRHRSALVRRAFAETTSLRPDGSLSFVNLDLLRNVAVDDPVLRHSARIALRDQYTAPNSGGVVDGSFQDENSRLIADVALGVHSKHSALYLISHLLSGEPDTARISDFLQHIGRYADSGIHIQRLGLFFDKLKDNPAKQVTYFVALQRGFQQRGEPLPSELVKRAETVAKEAIGSKDRVSFQAGVELASSLKLSALFDQLTTLAVSRETGEGQRGAILPALASIDATKATPTISKLLADAGEPIGLREQAARTLGTVNRAESRKALVDSLVTAEARLAGVIAASVAGSPQGADQLLKACEDGKASPRLLQERVVLQRLNESKLPNAASRAAKLTKGLPSADQRIAEIMNQRRAGFQKAKADIAVGAQVFTKNCAICHQINNQGTKIGPQLDGIGGRGLERLLEDILDPSRNVDGGMRQTTINLKNGGVLNGLVLREVGEVIVLADQNGKEVNVKKDDIEDRRFSPLSPMPANVQEIIPEKDFYDLMAYLLAQRAKEK